MERRLPAYPLIELILGQGVVQGRVGAFAWIEGLLPVRRAAGQGDRRWRCGLAEILEDGLNGAHLGDEGEDPHRLATAGAEERELASSARQADPSLGLAFIDPCEQHGPEIASTGTWLGVGLILHFDSRWRGVSWRGLRREACAGRHRRAQRGIRGEEPVIPMVMSARGRDEHGHRSSRSKGVR